MTQLRRRRFGLITDEVATGSGADRRSSLRLSPDEGEELDGCVGEPTLGCAALLRDVAAAGNDCRPLDWAAGTRPEVNQNDTTPR